MRKHFQSALPALTLSASRIFPRPPPTAPPLSAPTSEALPNPARTHHRRGKNRRQREREREKKKRVRRIFYFFFFRLHGPLGFFWASDGESETGSQPTTKAPQEEAGRGHKARESTQDVRTRRRSRRDEDREIRRLRAASAAEGPEPRTRRATNPRGAGEWITPESR